MTRLTTYLHSLLTALLAVAALAACSREEPESLTKKPVRPAQGVTFNDDGTLGITFGMEIPGMAATRALDENPNYNDLHLYMLVFEDGQGLEQYAELTPLTVKPDGTHENSGLVSYKLSLEPTEANAVIHLIATNQPDFKMQIGYGTEERVVPSLCTYLNEDGTANEAYWQRIVLGHNIPSAESADPDNEKYNEEDAKKAAQIAAKMRHVPMIRNFCRVSVQNGDPDNFTLTGIFVLNTTDCGTVAPYVAGNEPDSRFVDYFVEGSNPYSIRSYDDISAQKHIGTLPAGVKIINKLADVIASEPEEASTSPVYFYERPARVNSTERTYVIVR